MSNKLIQYKAHLRGGFCQIPNDYIQRPPKNVSTEAWFLFLYLYSQSKEYIPTQEVLAKQRDNSIAKVRRLVAELIEAHYLKVERVGRTEYHWLLYASPYK